MAIWQNTGRVSRGPSRAGMPKGEGKNRTHSKSTVMIVKNVAPPVKNVSSATSGDYRIRGACVRVLYHGRVCAEPEGNCKKNRSAVKQLLQL